MVSNESGQGFMQAAFRRTDVCARLVEDLSAAPRSLAAGSSIPRARSAVAAASSAQATPALRVSEVSEADEDFLDSSRSASPCALESAPSARASRPSPAAARASLAFANATKSITLRVDLDTALTRERIAQDTPMLRQNLRVAVAQLVRQPCRSLDVREQERDSAAREASHPPA
jgi:hypothetical protein